MFGNTERDGPAPLSPSQLDNLPLPTFPSKLHDGDLHPTPLRITIIGAGIAGLTCALALRQAGHTVTILEKSRFLQETGAAMYLGPNCGRLLHKLGLDSDKLGGNEYRGHISVDGLTGEEKVKAPMDPNMVREKWGHPWMLAHRVDFHDELRRMVESGDGFGRHAELILGIKVLSIDAESGKVELEDGRAFEGDVVIGADGNKSFARGVVDVEGKVKLRPWGKSCYRWVMEKEKLAADPETRELVAEEGFFRDILGPDRKFVQYPCRDNTMYNFAAFLPEDEGKVGDWEQEANKAKLLAGFSNFFPAARKVLTYAHSDLKMWQLVDMDSLSKWNRGRVALIGDAAHPFLPFLAQGAAQAIEDAVSIALLVSHATTAREVPELLELYDSIRRERVEYIRAQTRVNGLDDNKGKPPTSFIFNMFDYCNKHDEYDNTLEKIREWLDDRAVS